MNKTIIVIAAVLIWMSGCAQTHKSDANLFDQYSCLLQKTYDFLDEPDNKYLIDSIDHFIRTNEEYDFNRGRLEYIISKPFLFNTDNTKMIIMIIIRGLDNGNRVERVKFVSAQQNDRLWVLKLNKGKTLSYSYIDGQPTISDQEITLRSLRSIIDKGYLKKNSCNVDDTFFSTIWY